MRITQGAFSFLPDLTDKQISAQVKYALGKGWAISVEHTDDPHPRNTYWEMFGIPMFDLRDPAGALQEINDCRKTFPNHYVRVMAFDSTHQVESIVLSFIVQRPKDEPGFHQVRQEIDGRKMRYTTAGYAVAANAEGKRY
jgi:ribulose-bisphosphate carboxylase small chain